MGGIVVLRAIKHRIWLAVLGMRGTFGLMVRTACHFFRPVWIPGYEPLFI